MVQGGRESMKRLLAVSPIAAELLTHSPHRRYGPNVRGYEAHNLAVMRE
jgi:hypothetical protein